MRFSHPPVIETSRQNKRVAPLVFQGSCNTEVVDVYFEEMLLPGLVFRVWDFSRCQTRALLSAKLDKALNGRRSKCFAR